MTGPDGPEEEAPGTERALIDSSQFDMLYGLELLECRAEEVRARVRVRPEILDSSGAVHGGVFAAIAEGMASGGTNWSTSIARKAGMGMVNSTSFMQPIDAGCIHAVARRRHSEGDTWVWDVEMRNDGGELCAVSRVTIALRPFVRASRPGVDI
jgi:uncharacterized protein (TIGR00369 family)